MKRISCPHCGARFKYSHVCRKHPKYPVMGMNRAYALARKNNNMKKSRKTSQDKYGVGTFEMIVEHLWAERERLTGYDFLPFGYPDYWGLPKKLSKKLGPDAVDYIQMILDNFALRKKEGKRITKNQFVKEFREAFFILS